MAKSRTIDDKIMKLIFDFEATETPIGPRLYMNERTYKECLAWDTNDSNNVDFQKKED